MYFPNKENSALHALKPEALHYKSQITDIITDIEGQSQRMLPQATLDPPITRKSSAVYQSIAISYLPGKRLYSRPRHFNAKY